ELSTPCGRRSGGEPSAIRPYVTPNELNGFRMSRWSVPKEKIAMLSRRAFITGAIATATGFVALSNRAQVSAREWLLRAAAQGDEPKGTPYPLVALPHKQPLGQVYELPPNYETPTPKL